MLYKALMICLAVLMIGALVSCASEAPETQKLYTDAKQMWDELNNAFTLEKGQARIDMMSKILNEEWDVKIITNLEAYLKAAPTGKFAAEATALLSEAKNSDKLKMLGQTRPMLQMMGGIPKTPEQVDSLAKKAEAQDTTK